MKFHDKKKAGVGAQTLTTATTQYLHAAGVKGFITPSSLRRPTGELFYQHLSPLNRVFAGRRRTEDYTYPPSEE